jgi:hypothetical protein
MTEPEDLYWDNDAFPPDEHHTQRENPFWTSPFSPSEPATEHVRSFRTHASYLRAFRQLALGAPERTLGRRTGRACRTWR